jgi:uncharacterized RDD family membrane protein YckC
LCQLIHHWKAFMTGQPPPGNYPPPPPGGYPPPPGSGQSYPPQQPPPGYGAPAQPPPGYGAHHQPPPGYGAPQPPAGYGAPQQGGYGAAPAAPVLPKEAYTPWVTRAIAWFIDYIPAAIMAGIGVGLLAGTRETVQACVTDTSEFDLGEFCAEGTQPSTIGWVGFYLFAVLLTLVYVVWNYGYRQGTTGSSIGKSVMKFQVVSEKTWQPIGFGLSIVRQFAHLIDGLICYIGYLFPLWDPKRQTLADKIMTTVCVPFSPAESAPY